MGFSVRVAKGVRISTSSRGIRTSRGPRSTRLHVGGGVRASQQELVVTRTGLNFPAQRDPPGRPPKHQLHRVRGKLRRSRDWMKSTQSAILKHRLSLGTRNTFHRCNGTIAPEPAIVEARTIHRRMRAQEKRGVSPFRFLERRAAKKRANTIAEKEIKDQQAERAATRRRSQDVLDERDQP